MPSDRPRRPRRPRRSRSRARSPEVVARQERLRRRILDQRAAQREREKAVTAAVRDYLAAWHAIGLTAQRRDQDVERLQQQITDVTADATSDIAGHEHEQALAAAAIHAQGHSDEEIAELLEITVKRARQLLATARKSDTTPPAPSPPVPSATKPHRADKDAGDRTEHAVQHPDPRGSTHSDHHGSGVEGGDDADLPSQVRASRAVRRDGDGGRGGADVERAVE